MSVPPICLACLNEVLVITRLLIVLDYVVVPDNKTTQRERERKGEGGSVERQRGR